LRRATIITHIYARHLHDEVMIGVIEEGVQGFACGGPTT
jgi:hypothetical protein